MYGCESKILVATSVHLFKLFSNMINFRELDLVHQKYLGKEVGITMHLGCLKT